MTESMCRSLRRLVFTRHRTSCPLCKFNEALHGLPWRYDDSCPNLISINQAH